MKKLLLFSTVLLSYTCSFGQITVSTLAGSGTAGNDDGTGTAASFYQPRGVAVDASGNVYVADYVNHKIRKITAAGVVSTFAGSGTAGSDDGTGTVASFSGPFGVAIDASGNIYVADAPNHKIRKITAAGVVSTLAGSGSIGSTDGIGTAASFYQPRGVAVDAFGNVYVADAQNHKIRKITSAGVVSTFAGSGTVGSDDGTGIAASFSWPSGVAVDTSGNIYVADMDNNKIRKITSEGVVSTFAGSGAYDSTDDTGTAASFRNPFGVALDASGNVYVADAQNNKIRKITSAGAVSTFAGSVNEGSADGTISARFFLPVGVAVDAFGNVYVADWGNHKIRKIVDASLSNADFDIASNIVIYPNPTTNFVTIKVSDLLDAKLQVIDITGRVLLKQILDNATNSVDISQLPNGLYLFKVTATEGSTISKVVKN